MAVEWSNMPKWQSMWCWGHGFSAVTIIHQAALSTV